MDRNLNLIEMTEKRMVIFDVGKEYNDIQGTKQHAFVSLTIDYANHTFWIVPSNWETSSSFIFKKNPKEANMWIAVAELIAEATQLAKEELGI